MKGQCSKLFVVTVAFLLIAGACAAPPPPATPTPIPPTPTPDPAAPVKAWVDAINSGDVDATLALFADDLKFSVFEYNATDKDQLRGIFDWLAGLETKYQITECQTKEDRVVCTMPVSDACIAGYDPVDGLMSTMTFVPQQDGKISQVSGYPDGFGDYYAKWISPAMTWMRANRAEELAKAESTSDGREAGAINAKLCKEYGESLKSTPTPMPPTPISDPAAPVKAWVDAINSGDVDAALALFADDVQYDYFFQAIGKEQLRSVFDWLVGINVKDAVRDCQQPQSDRVVCTFTGVDDCMAASGATDGLAAKATYIFGDDGKIRQVGGMGEGAGWDSYQNWIISATNWMQINRAEEYDKADYNRGRDGALQIKLCKEYAASLKSVPTATPVPPTPAPSSDLEKLAKSFADAFNKRDLDTALALFVDEGLLFMWDEAKTGSKQSVRDWLEYMIGRGTQLTIADCAPKGKALGCVLEWRDDYGVKAWTGLDVARYDLTVNARDNKIQLFSMMSLPKLSQLSSSFIRSSGTGLRLTGLKNGSR